MRKIVLGLAALLLTLTACGHDNRRDVKGVAGQRPYIELWNNMDGHPNIGLVCIHGAGFATTTRPDFAALQYIPAWDNYCHTKMP